MREGKIKFETFFLVQAIHNSHSTLDRTCSDSVVSLKYRKSTSDLTEASETQPPVQPLHRRRGSSKVNIVVQLIKLTLILFLIVH